MGDFRINREGMSIWIVAVDSLIILIFMFAVVRLRWYERLAINDIREGKSKIEDFTVFIKDIPIDKSLYHNNPELLKAMMTLHLEDIVSQEPQINFIDDTDRYEDNLELKGKKLPADQNGSIGPLLAENRETDNSSAQERRLKESDIV